MKAKCVPYEYFGGDFHPNKPCQCPKCGGFLKWIDNVLPVCNKCHADLIILPDHDEETDKELECGRICLIGDGKVEGKKE